MAWIAAVAAVGGAMIENNAQNQASAEMRRASGQAYGRSLAAADKAEREAKVLYNDAMANSLMGSQAALDIFGQSVPAQMGAFQAGNINAQNTLSGGLNAQLAAMLGGQVDLSGVQPQVASEIPEQTMFQQQVPHYNRGPSTQERLAATMNSWNALGGEQPPATPGGLPNPGLGMVAGTTAGINPNVAPQGFQEALNNWQVFQDDSNIPSTMFGGGWGV